jgi:hypothetical protein
LNLVVSGLPYRHLAYEYTTDGYSGGELGSIVKLSDGRYFVAWASRGVRATNTLPIEVAMDTHDIGFVVLSGDYVPLTRPDWLFSTPNVDEINFHLAPYGDRLLAVWETVNNPVCRSGVCVGAYGGTHVRLFRTDGSPVGPAEDIPWAPNGGDDIVVLPDFDLAWAFAGDARDPSTLINAASGAPSVPPTRQIGIARFALCSD